MPPTSPPMTAAPFHSASVTVRPKPSRSDFCRTTAAARCSAFTRVGSSTARTMMPSSVTLSIVLRIFPPSGSSEALLPTSTVHLLSRLSESLDYAHRIFPSIEPRNLGHQRTICRNFVVAQEFPHLPVGQLPVLRREWIDRRCDELLVD